MIYPKLPHADRVGKAKAAALLAKMRTVREALATDAVEELDDEPEIRSQPLHTLVMTVMSEPKWAQWKD